MYLPGNVVVAAAGQPGQARRTEHVLGEERPDRDARRKARPRQDLGGDQDHQRVALLRRFDRSGGRGLDPGVGHVALRLAQSIPYSKTLWNI
jgi:hypothetical protein